MSQKNSLFGHTLEIWDYLGSTVLVRGVAHFFVSKDRGTRSVALRGVTTWYAKHNSPFYSQYIEPWLLNEVELFTPIAFPSETGKEVVKEFNMFYHYTNLSGWKLYITSPDTNAKAAPKPSYLDDNVVAVNFKVKKDEN